MSIVDGFVTRLRERLEYGRCRNCKRRADRYCALYAIPDDRAYHGRMTTTIAEARAPGGLCGPEGAGFKHGEPIIR